MKNFQLQPAVSCLSVSYPLGLRLSINSGVRQWRGHGVATGALFGVSSDILIWPHFHSQATMPFVLAGVCCGCVNLLTTCRNCVYRGIQLTFKGGGGEE